MKRTSEEEFEDSLHLIDLNELQSRHRPAAEKIASKVTRILDDAEDRKRPRRLPATKGKPSALDYSDLKLQRKALADPFILALETSWSYREVEAVARELMDTGKRLRDLWAINARDMDSRPA